MIHSIKTAIDPICARMEIPKKDKERLIKIYASQKRFFKTEENNPTHNEVFRKKDFFKLMSDLGLIVKAFFEVFLALFSGCFFELRDLPWKLSGGLSSGEC